MNDARAFSGRGTLASPFLAGMLAALAAVGSLCLYCVEQRIITASTAALFNLPFLGLALWSTKQMRRDWKIAREREEALVEAMARQIKQNAVLTEAARNPERLGEKPETAFRAITAMGANTLETARASIWFYNEDRTKIRCADLFDREAGSHSSGLELNAADYPVYFRALATERTIATYDATTDPRTREFAPGYFIPLGITSTIEAAIRSGGNLVGIMCLEHNGQRRAWLPDEEIFAGSVADLVSLSLEVAQRRQAEAALREAHHSLEAKVAERTRDLEEANERLKELDRLKSEFLGTMSHELRTPLNSIIGFSGILRQELAGPLNDEQKKQLGMLNASAKHLLTLINNILDLSRIESGRMEVFWEQFKPSEIVAEVVANLAPLAKQKGLTLETGIENAEIRIRSDRKKCLQILVNLVNNAIKFTEKGGIRIETRSEARDFTFSISDTGIGIEPHAMERLFEAFRQVDGSAQRHYEGAGLGLHLSKALAELLHGRLRAESEIGKGSRFHLSLPVESTPSR